MKILIAGLGSIGRRHLRNLLALGERDILLYHTGRSVLPEDELRGFPVETELAAALEHHPEAVIVANPTALHLEVAIPAAERGCHLLVEKPLSHSLEGVERLQEAVRRGGGQVLVGFQFRFHPGLQKIKQLISSPLTPYLNSASQSSDLRLTAASSPASPSPAAQARQAQRHASDPSPLTSPIGRPLSARAHWGEYLPGWHPWEDYRQGYSARLDLGGGALLTLSHPLDYLRWFFGEVEALWAFIGRLGDLALDVEDTAEIGLRFANGVLGSVHLDYNQRPSAHTLEIVGTQGTIHWDNADGVVHVYQFPVEAEGLTTLQIPVPAGFERNDLFLREMRHFLAVARGEEEPACTLDDGIRALRLALAARQSSEAGEIAIL
jgi:predicted dehydrogenase